MNRKIFIIIQLSLVLSLVSCIKEDPANLPLKGSITGKIRLADEFGTLLTDHGQVTVTTNNGIKGNTNPGGSYLVYGLGDGTYDLTFSKYGFGTYTRFGTPVTNLENTTLTGIDTLGQVSSTLISGLTAIPDYLNANVSFNCNVTPVPDSIQQRAIRLFFSKNPSVSASDYEYTPGNKWMADNANGTINNFALSNFLNNGFSKGDTVYSVAYGESYYANNYIDHLSGKKVFPNVNADHPSNVVMFVLQ